MTPSQVIADEISGKVLYEKNSLYQYIRVEDDDERNERYLIVDNRQNLFHGAMNIDTPDRLLLEYTQMSFAGLAFLNRAPGSVLFVGLGAGVMPRYFSKYYSTSDIDIVELDPEMFKISKKFFHFSEKDNMKVHIADGRVFLKRTKKKYDIIFLDAYQGAHIPFHLTTVEFLQDVKNKLNDGGVVVSNILSTAKNKFFYSMLKTYIQEFPHLYCFKGRISGNFIFIAAASDMKMESINLWARAGKIMDETGMDIDLPLFIQESYAYYTEYEKDAEVLTDDFAPVNLYRHMDN
jgi:spermidine synthase